MERAEVRPENIDKDQNLRSVVENAQACVAEFRSDGELSEGAPVGRGSSKVKRAPPKPTPTLPGVLQRANMRDMSLNLDQMRWYGFYNVQDDYMSRFMGREQGAAYANNFKQF